jgi:hypothetical protein
MGLAITSVSCFQTVRESIDTRVEAEPKPPRESKHASLALRSPLTLTLSPSRGEGNSGRPAQSWGSRAFRYHVVGWDEPDSVSGFHHLPPSFVNEAMVVVAKRKHVR